MRVVKGAVMAVILVVAIPVFAQMGGDMMGSQGMMQQGTQQQSQEGARMPLSLPATMGYPMMGPMMGSYGGYPMMNMMSPAMMGGYGIAPAMGCGLCGGYGMMSMGAPMMTMMHNMMMGGGYGMGPMMMFYGGWYGERYKRFLDETRELRKQLYLKNFEYFEALRDPKTDRKELVKMQKEMYELRKKIMEKSPWPFAGCPQH